MAEKYKERIAYFLQQVCFLLELIKSKIIQPDRALFSEDAYAYLENSKFFKSEFRDTIQVKVLFLFISISKLFQLFK